MAYLSYHTKFENIMLLAIAGAPLNWMERCYLHQKLRTQLLAGRTVVHCAACSRLIHAAGDVLVFDGEEQEFMCDLISCLEESVPGLAISPDGDVALGDEDDMHFVFGPIMRQEYPTFAQYFKLETRCAILKEKLARLGLKLSGPPCLLRPR